MACRPFTAGQDDHTHCRTGSFADGYPGLAQRSEDVIFVLCGWVVCALVPSLTTCQRLPGLESKACGMPIILTVPNSKGRPMHFILIIDTTQRI